MKLILTSVPLSLLLLPFVSAAGTCSSSGSLAWPPVGDCSTSLRYPTATQKCRACCLNDGNCFQACAKAAGIGKRDAMSEQSFGFNIEKKNLQGRAVALSCSTYEDCYRFTDGSLLCLNLGTGAYHDDVGGEGNYFSGVYTGPDGKVQTGTSSATATGSARTSTARTQTGSTSTTTGGSTSTAAAGSSTSTGAANAISPAGGNFLRLGANVGILGLVAGLVL